MSHIPVDPNNHAPEVSPGDDWCDPEQLDYQGSTTHPSALPPRRSVARQAEDFRRQASDRKKPDAGLRIDSNLSRADSATGNMVLEVQEITGKVTKLDQLAPAPQKVARHVAFHAKPASEPVPVQERGEGREWGREKRRSMRWLIGAGAATVSAVILTLLLLPAINAPNAVQADPNIKVVIEEKEARIAGVEEMNALVTRRDEAERILEKISRAGYVDDILPFVFKGTEMKEILHKTWHSLARFRQWSPAGPGQWDVFESNHRPYAMLAGNLPDHSVYSTYFTTVDGRLMLDWKATTAFGTATFEELAQRRGDPSEIRGVISATEFYSATWPEETYRSFRLVSPDQTASLWCYVRRGSAAEAAIAPLFNSGEIVQEAESERKITLRLEPGPEGSLPNQWLIGEVLHVDWATS